MKNDKLARIVHEPEIAEKCPSCGLPYTDRLSKLGFSAGTDEMTCNCFNARNWETKRIETLKWLEEEAKEGRYY